MENISEIIRKRYSCRSFSDEFVEDAILKKLSLLADETQPGPFGGKPRFQIIGTNALDPRKWKKLGTYGVIKNARLYLAGIMKRDCLELDYGYVKECLILKATEMGLGTCWLGGTFSSGGFALASALKQDEILATVSPLGYAAESKSMTERIMRRLAGSDQRKSWSNIFYRK